MRSPTLVITSWSTLVETFRDKLSQLGLLWTGKHTLAPSPHSSAWRRRAPHQLRHRTSVHAHRGTTVTAGLCAAPWSLCVDARRAAGWCHATHAHTPAGRPRARHWLPAVARRQPPRWPYRHPIVDTGMRKLPLHSPGCYKIPPPFSMRESSAPAFRHYRRSRWSPSSACFRSCPTPLSSSLAPTQAHTTSHCLACSRISPEFEPKRLRRRCLARAISSQDTTANRSMVSQIEQLWHLFACSGHPSPPWARPTARGHDC
jgi:hypothetical protein